MEKETKKKKKQIYFLARGSRAQQVALYRARSTTRFINIYTYTIISSFWQHKKEKKNPLKCFVLASVKFLERFQVDRVLFGEMSDKNQPRSFPLMNRFIIAEKTSRLVSLSMAIVGKWNPFLYNLFFF